MTHRLIFYLSFILLSHHQQSSDIHILKRERIFLQGHLTPLTIRISEGIYTAGRRNLYLREKEIGKEGEITPSSHRLTLVIHIDHFRRADALNCAALQKF